MKPSVRDQLREANREIERLGEALTIAQAKVSDLREALSLAPTGECEISLSPCGFNLLLSLPRSQTGLTRHTVEIPNNFNGFACLLRILNSRRLSARPGQSPRLGSAGAPSQGQIDSWLSSGNRVKHFSEAGKIRLDLNEAEL